MDIKNKNGLIFSYIQERPWGSYYLVDIFGKLYRNGLTKPPYQSNNNNVIKMSYLYKGFQSPPSNLGYNKKNID